MKSTKPIWRSPMFMKSISTLLWAITLSTILLIPLEASFAYTCGDVNGDTAVNVADAVYLINYIFKGGPEPDCGTDLGGVCGDVNGDAFVNVGDAVYLINYIFKGGQAPYCLSYIALSSTVIIPPDDTTVIQSYDPATGIIVLDGSSIYAQEVSVGDVVIGQDEGDAPYGFLRKVASKSAQPGSVVLETETATIEETFERLYIHETHELRPTDVLSYKLHNGANYSADKDDMTFDVGLNVILYDQDGNHHTTEDQIRLEGDFAFEAALFGNIEWDWLGDKKLEFGIVTDQAANVDLIADLHYAFGEEEDFDLCEFRLTPIPLGGVVWITPTLTVKAHVRGDLSISFETGISYTQDLRYGFGWTNGEFYTISESTKNFIYTPPQITGEFDFEPGVSLSASTLIWGVFGPYAAGKAGFHFQATMNADPCTAELIFDLDAVLYALAGFECDIFGVDEYAEFELYNHQIGEWIIPLGGAGTIVIDPEPDSINAPWSLEGPCSYYTGGTGDDIIADLNPGDYAITWSNVAGWTAPAGEIQTLIGADTVIFSGTYEEGGPDSLGAVTDIDGNTYLTVKIGNQWWMAENLRVTHYCNGDPIPNVTDSGAWTDLTTGAYCEYGNDVTNAAIYGRLYNWYAVVDSRKIAPIGWHVPSDAEWQQMEMYLGMSQAEAEAEWWRGTDEGGKLKERGTIHWNSPNTGATNESGFTALAAGYRLCYSPFTYLGDGAVIWSSTEHDTLDTHAYHRTLYYTYAQIFRIGSFKENGLSVRCVKD